MVCRGRRKKVWVVGVENEIKGAGDTAVLASRLIPLSLWLFQLMPATISAIASLYSLYRLIARARTAPCRYEYPPYALHPASGSILHRRGPPVNVATVGES